MKSYCAKLFSGCCVALLVAATAGAATVAAQPARWRPYALIVDLSDLPKDYSCEDLWYKFRDVLKSLGANPQMRVTPYRCGHVPGERTRSPRVELFFKLPEALAGKEARWHDVYVNSAEVSLEPGAPASFTDADCELMRQIKDVLLPALPVRVVAYRLSCEAPSRHQPDFALTVQTLRPVAAVAMQRSTHAGAGG
jgi:hypothetical protein